ncbi:MAG: hypothetical protein H7Z21_06745 [Hymenobacter sp.]|nr:hypothetical protein [Hymenobacter sp.]
MEANPNPPGRWQADLNEFFAGIESENQAFSGNLKRQGAFYADTVRPALDAAAEALRGHGRTCETGLDQNRIYLIVRRPEGPVEFQYALVAEARIEAVTPYVHCWFEENELAEQSTQDRPQDAEADDEKPEDDASEDEDEDKEKKDDKKDDKKAARTKTIELLSSWADGRAIESVTREEILADFVVHYQEAVARLRSHLHAAPQ